ncbi:MAG: glycosyltransferase [Lachnospiraceae bacterium]|nr:glycosyltransferase [Lachnospiraceae bacterium]
MRDGIKVSIILPSLNVGAYISESIESARNQTLHDIEIICIDAGSTDGTWEKIQEQASEDDRIIALRSPVKSYGFQVNMGLDRARGRYVAVLETDDYVAEGMYGTLCRIAEEHGVDYVKCDYSTYVTDENGERLFTERRISMDRGLYSDVFKPSEHPDTVVDDWYLWNGIYDADFLRRNGIRFSETPGAAFQDIGFLHKTCSSAEKALYVGESLYRYCVDRDGASSNSDRTLKFIRKEYGLLVDGLGESPDSPSRNMLYRRMARSFVRACMDSTDGMLMEVEAADICAWFQRQLREAERWGYVKEDDIPISLRGGYRHLMSPAFGFVTYRGMRTREFYEFLSDGCSVIVFGCGVYGREACRFLKASRYEIAGFMDNNKKLWGNHIDGFAVMSPETIKELPDTMKYLVASEKYANDIANQLREYIASENIFIYTSELVYTENYKKRRK